jgi:hypothetical protein
LVYAQTQSEGHGDFDDDTTGRLGGRSIYRLCEKETLGSDNPALDERCDTYGLNNLRLGQLQEILNYASSDARLEKTFRFYVTEGAKAVAYSVITQESASIRAEAAVLRVATLKLGLSPSFYTRGDGEIVSKADMLLLGTGSDGYLIELLQGDPTNQFTAQLGTDRNKKFLSKFRERYFEGAAQFQKWS